MNLNTLKSFRHGMYASFEQAADTLFNVVDALSSETAAQSFPELSLSPFFARQWPSLYEAFKDGKIDADRLREVFVQFAPFPCAGQYVFVGVDTSSLFRPDATTSADRTLLPIPNMPERSHAVSPGWVISSVVLLPQEAGQGTFVLDSRRVTSSELATEVAASQVLAVVDLLVARGLRPVIIGDRGYACAPFLARMTDVPARCLLRVKANRVFYRPARCANLGSVGRVAKMEHAFNAAIRAPMGNRMQAGKGPIPRASVWKCGAGTSCICARFSLSRSA